MTADESNPDEPEVPPKQAEEDDDDNDNDDDEDADADGNGATKKKKRKKKKKKKKKTGNGPGPLTFKEPVEKPPHLGLNDTAFTDFAVKYGQTSPEPTIPVQLLFRGREYPKGEIQPHLLESQTYRETSAEVRARDRIQDDL